MWLNRNDAGRLAEQFSAALLLLLSFWVVGYRLDAVPMYLWDESRQANNALEMLYSGNISYSTYNGLPDFWNTKPHLLILLQWLCMKLLGPGLLALRLPSAIAACILLCSGFVFLKRRYGFSPAAAWITVMLGCGGFNTYHVARTGDYDALLTLFVFLASLSWLKYLENQDNRKTLISMTIWFTAALLTKGIAAAMWLPVWFAMGYAAKPHVSLKIGRVVGLGLIPLLAVVGYYGLHEWLTPGYIQAVLENEFSGRYLRPNEGHNTHWYYYPVVLWRDYFMAFIVLLITAAFVIRSVAHKQVYFRILMGVVVFLFILSLSATRIYWYVAPAIPLLAVLVVLPLADNPNRFFQASWKVVIAAIFVVGFFSNYRQNTTCEGVSAAQVLMKAEKMGALPYAATWHVGHYHPVEKYYAAVLRDRGLHLNISTRYDYKPQDTLIVSNMAHLDTLNRRFFMRQHHYPTHEMPIWVMVVDSVRSR